MACVTWHADEAPDPQTGASIHVYALNANKRPVGFAPWPKVKKPKKDKA